MRITFHSDAVMLGGAEHTLATLMRHLDRRHRVEIVVADRAVGEFLGDQRPVERVRVVPSPRSRRQLDRTAGLIAAVRASRPDILHVNRTWLWQRQVGVLGGLLTRGARVVVVEHSQPQPAASRQDLMLGRWIARRLDALVAVGVASARGIEQYAGLSPGAVRVIHNGVEIVPERPPRPDPGPLATVGAIGRLSPEKGYEDLIGLLERVAAARVVLVGDGPERERLQALAAERGVGERFEITGWQPDPERFLAEFDLLTAPSRAEGSPPLTVLDAMMLGVPVVAADVGSVAEAVADGDTGLLVPPQDPDALAAAVERLLGDAGLRTRLAAGARKRALAEFSAPRMASDFEALYAELLNRRRASAPGPAA